MITHEECNEVFGHEFGYNEEAGICERCSLLHDCLAEFDFELDLNDNWACSVCHIECDEATIKEINLENKEYSLLDSDYRRAVLG